MTDAPETIYLQWIPEGHPADDEITWCVDKIHKNDTEYTRTGIAHPRIAEMESEIEEANNAIDDLMQRIAELEDVNEHLRIALNDCDIEITAKDARIAEKDDALEMIEAGYSGLQYEMNKQLAEKNAMIEDLKGYIDTYYE